MRSQQFIEANGDRPGVPNVAILITDGASNVNEQNTIPAAQYAKEKGITIFRWG